MFKSNSETIIANVADALLTPEMRKRIDVPLPTPNSSYYQGVLFQLNLNVDDPTLTHYTRAHTAQTRVFYVAFCSNVSVFVADQMNEEKVLVPFFNIPTKNWVNTSNHDSCWRTDGMSWLTTLYFEMCDVCNPNVPPASLTSDCRIGFARPWETVDMVIQRPTDDSDKYKLLSIAVPGVEK